MEEVEDAAKTRQQAAQYMSQKFGAAHVDAQHVGALAAAAHSVETAAQLGPAQQAEEEYYRQQRDNNAHLHIGRDILAQLVGGTKAGYRNTNLLYRQKALVGHAHWFLTDNGCHALGKEHTCQRDNKGLDAQVGHQEALDHAKGQTNPQTNQNNRQDIAALPLQIYRAGHADQARDGSYADVDAAGNHHHAHAAGQDNQRGVVIQDIQEILRFGKTAAQKQYGGKIQDEEDHNGDGKQQVGVAHGRPFFYPALFVNCNSP